MNRNNKLNPVSSPHLQSLLDLQTVVDPKMPIGEAILLLQEDAKSDCHIVNELNDLWNRHLYPNRVLKFSPVVLYDLSANITELSPEATKLLIIMVQVQCQRTGYVAVRKAIFAKACGFGTKRARHMQNYLDELVEQKFIKLIFQPSKGSSAAAIYQVNRKFSRIGSTFQPDVLDKHYKPMFSRSLTTIKVNKDKKETLYQCGTLEDIAYININGTNAVNTNPTNANNLNFKSKSNNNNNSNSNNSKNQDIDDLQMTFEDFIGIIPEE